MTRDNLRPATGAVRRAASLLTGALMIAGLAGCGSISSQNADSANLAQKAKPSMALSPVTGVPDKYAAKINQQMTAAVKDKGVQIVDAKDADLVVKTAYTALPAAKKGTKVSYAIDVIDKTGAHVKKIEGDEIVSKKRGGLAWKHVTEDALQKVALRSSTELNAWIDNPNAPAPQPAVATAEPASTPSSKPVKVAKKEKDAAASPTLAASVTPAAAGSREPIAVVPAVTGAPGDGKTALSEAMKKALTEQGVKIAASGKGTYKVQGQVEMGQPSGGTQPITIRWLVTDPAGKPLKNGVVQNNSVAAGQLDTTWGPIAEQAAGAAALEVMKLINKTPGGQAQQAGTGSAG